MVTVAHIVEKVVKSTPFLEEVLARGLVNYASLAESIKNDVEKELGSSVNIPAIVMSIRRLQDKLSNDKIRQPKITFKESDLTIKSDLFEVTVFKSGTIINAIKKIYGLIDFQKGDFLTITHGIYEITILSNKQHKANIKKILEEEKIEKVIDNLASLTIKIPLNAVATRGIFYVLTKALNWEDINIIEIVSTLTELTFILKEEDISKAFNVIKRLISQ